MKPEKIMITEFAISSKTINLNNISNISN